MYLPENEASDADGSCRTVEPTAGLKEGGGPLADKEHLPPAPSS